MDERDHLLARRDILRAYVVVLAQPPELLAVCAAADGDEDARRRLEARFGFSDVEADAVLQLQVRRFTPDQIARIRAELAELEARIARME